MTVSGNSMMQSKKTLLMDLETLTITFKTKLMVLTLFRMQKVAKLYSQP
jgi:hypothetical protein